ncbi:hypothetical protein [Nostoc sp. UHCC 0870]|uniref:hypothetical protein n=1 Tax=Nostoc sp. UHCC 0870 TaxID=2914041 RepID=UPI001EDD65F9|nr:hypothetical protein [Nostoc sp. UHCC 0870]UKP01463.1 hypothetical protein L6494_30120 [Nostoc sp. UHCC 0870]
MQAEVIRGEVVIDTQETTRPEENFGQNQQSFMEVDFPRRGGRVKKTRMGAKFRRGRAIKPTQHRNNRLEYLVGVKGVLGGNFDLAAVFFCPADGTNCSRPDAPLFTDTHTVKVFCSALLLGVKLSDCCFGIIYSKLLLLKN